MSALPVAFLTFLASEACAGNQATRSSLLDMTAAAEKLAIQLLWPRPPFRPEPICPFPFPFPFFVNPDSSSRVQLPTRAHRWQECCLVAVAGLVALLDLPATSTWCKICEAILAKPWGLSSCCRRVYISSTLQQTAVLQTSSKPAHSPIPARTSSKCTAQVRGQRLPSIQAGKSLDAKREAAASLSAAASNIRLATGGHQDVTGARRQLKELQAQVRALGVGWCRSVGSQGEPLHAVSPRVASSRLVQTRLASTRGGDLSP